MMVQDIVAWCLLDGCITLASLAGYFYMETRRLEGIIDDLFQICFSLSKEGKE